MNDDLSEFLHDVLTFCAETVPFNCWAYALAKDADQVSQNWRLTGGAGLVLVVPTDSIRLALLVGLAFSPDGLADGLRIMTSHAIRDSEDYQMRPDYGAHGRLPIADWYFDPRRAGVSKHVVVPDPFDNGEGLVVRVASDRPDAVASAVVAHFAEYPDLD